MPTKWALALTAYREPERYLKPIELIFAEFCKVDSIPVPAIVVSVAVPQHYTNVCLTSGSLPKESAIENLALI